MSQGRLYVISAPSGAGKSTILKQVMANVTGLAFSVSHTTRAPRSGEQDGVDYHFTSREQFLEMVDKGHFLEHAKVHGNLYGTSKQSVLEQIANGIDVILDIDVQGAALIRSSEMGEGTYVFIAPPSITELEKRLRGRDTENDVAVKMRLKNALDEMKAAKEYEYIVVNDRLQEAVELLTAIIWAERARAHRLPSGKSISTTRE